MDSQLKSDARIKGLLVSAVMLISISFIALYIYATYISPTARESISSGILLILVYCALGILVGLNLIYFSIKMKKRFPGIARTLPVGYVLASFFFFWIYKFLLGYPPTPQGVILFSLISLGIWLLLNLIIYFIDKKGPVRAR